MDLVCKTAILSFFAILIFAIFISLLPSFTYSFSWDEIPGKEGDRLVDSLKNYDVLTNAEEINKTSDGRIIIIENPIIIGVPINIEPGSFFGNERRIFLELRDNNKSALLKRELTNKYYDSFDVKIFNVKLKLEPYLLSWDKIPGKENNRLLEYLKNKYNASWVENGKIEKTDLGRTVRIFDGNNFLNISFDYDKAKASLILYNYLDSFDIKMVNGELNIELMPYSVSWDEIPGEDSVRLVDYLEKNYNLNWIKKGKIEKINHDRTIIISNLNNSLYISLDYNKAKAFLGVYRYDDLDIELDDSKLNIELPYLLSWYAIPGEDSVRFVDYLEKKYDLNWIGKGKIEKTDSERTIRISDGNNSLNISLENYNEKASLIIDNYTDSFDVETMALKLPYSLSWEKIPGEDSVRLADYLEKNYAVNPIQIEKIQTLNDTITDGENFLINLSHDKTKASLKVTNRKTLAQFPVESINDKLYLKVPRFKEISIEKETELEKQIFPIIIFSSFLIISFMSYRVRLSKISMKILTKLETLYPKFPLLIMGIGYLILVILIISNDISSWYMNILLILGIVIFIPVGTFLFIVTLFSKRYLEGRIHFTLKKANRILDNIENESSIDVNNLKRYIYLTYKNFKKKLGKGLELKVDNGSNGISKLDLEYTFLNYFPIYIKSCSTEQLNSLKNNIETMSTSVDENDEIRDWNVFTTAILSLNNDIITYLRENNLNLIYSSEMKLGRIFKNKDLISDVLKLIMAILPIIYYIITKQLPK